MSTLQKELFEMLFVLPESSLKSLKPLFNELLNAAVLSKDPTAQVDEMDEVEKRLFLRTIEQQAKGEYVSFEDALEECGLSLSEL